MLMPKKSAPADFLFLHFVNNIELVERDKAGPDPLFKVQIIPCFTGVYSPRKELSLDKNDQSKGHINPKGVQLPQHRKI